MPYSTLNDLVNQKLPVENIKSGQLKSIADALYLDMDTLYSLCQVNRTVTSKQYNIQATIIVEHKNYYLDFISDNHKYKLFLLPVKHDATAYLDTLAEWKLDEKLDSLEMEKTYESIHFKTT